MWIKFNEWFFHRFSEKDFYWNKDNNRVNINLKTDGISLESLLAFSSISQTATLIVSCSIISLYRSASWGLTFGTSYRFIINLSFCITYCSKRPTFPYPGSLWNGFSFINDWIDNRIVDKVRAGLQEGPDFGNHQKDSCLKKRNINLSNDVIPAQVLQHKQ